MDSNPDKIGTPPKRSECTEAKLSDILAVATREARAKSGGTAAALVEIEARLFASAHSRQSTERFLLTQALREAMSDFAKGNPDLCFMMDGPSVEESSEVVVSWSHADEIETLRW